MEKRRRVGQGVAYSTRNPAHVLNVPARGMSAFADQPDHFWQWLRNSGHVDLSESYVFSPRFAYGEYLESLLREFSLDPDRPGLRVISSECVALKETTDEVRASFSDGDELVNDAAVIAVGHEERQMRGRGLAVRAGSDRDTRLDPDGTVMILGSGLSMVDAWLSLAGNHHKGPVLVLSRNGLLPHRHVQCPPADIRLVDVPLGASPGEFVRWLAGRIDQALEKGQDWRSVIDGLRPYNQKIWQNWPLPMRWQFLAHVRPFWNIHRHRLPPELHDALKSAVEAGRITLMAGTFLGVSEPGAGLAATFRRRGAPDCETVNVSQLYDCGGVAVDVDESSNPLVRSLVSDGLARPDPLRTGLDVTSECALICRNGAPSRRVFAIGPLTRSEFFEIESVPEIRVQARSLAKALLTDPVADGSIAGAETLVSSPD